MDRLRTRITRRVFDKLINSPWCAEVFARVDPRRKIPDDVGQRRTNCQQSVDGLEREARRVGSAANEFSRINSLTSEGRSAATNCEIAPPSIARQQPFLKLQVRSTPDDVLREIVEQEGFVEVWAAPCSPVVDQQQAKVTDHLVGYRFQAELS